MGARNARELAANQENRDRVASGSHDLRRTLWAGRCALDPRGSHDDLTTLSLEELLDVEIEVASTRKRPLRASPEIVTAIGRQEILNSGAHDLIDVLRTLPGFTFGADVEGVVGIGILGVWAHEGKVSLLLDGQEMNERISSTPSTPSYSPTTAGTHRFRGRLVS